MSQLLFNYLQDFGVFQTNVIILFLFFSLYNFHYYYYYYYYCFKNTTHTNTYVSVPEENRVVLLLDACEIVDLLNIKS